MIIFFIVFLIVYVMDFIYSYYKYGAISAYGVAPYEEERWMEKYGVGPDWDE